MTASEPHRLYHGDALAILPTLAADSLDACVTDPPYGLGSVRDLPGLITAWLRGEDGADYQTTGFMGHAWDIVPAPALWRAVYRVLKPGAHLLAFAGTRTWDVMSLSIRLAGFELRDSIAIETVRWYHAQGFPKHHLSDSGQGSTLKPAFEPVLMFRKPFAGTIAANVQRYGTGALNIDASRIAHRGRYPAPWQKSLDWSPQSDPSAFLSNMHGQTIAPHSAGRYPTNVLLCHTLFCTADTCDPACPVARLAAQSGVRRTGTAIRPRSSGKTFGGTTARPPLPDLGYDDTGTAARFFAQFPTVAADFQYCTKASRAERNNGGVPNTHVAVKPLALMRYLIALVTPPAGSVLDPFLGSGTTTLAAHHEGRHSVGIERDAAYLAIARARLSAYAGDTATEA